MSLFKERAANAKKVIALQNEIYSLKNQLKSQPAAPAECSECPELEAMVQEALAKQEELASELKSVKSDLKKSRSEVTKLNKKLASFESND
jgi:chromosome segregation ATPase